MGLVELDSGDLTAADVARLKTPIAEAVANFRALDTSISWSRRMDEIVTTLDAIPDDPYRALPDLEPISTNGTVFVISRCPRTFPPISRVNGRTTPPYWVGRSTASPTSGSGARTRPSSPSTSSITAAAATTKSLLHPDDFFDDSDFGSADHHIRGEFDENGDFLGTIRIFDEGANRRRHHLSEATAATVRPLLLRTRRGPGRTKRIATRPGSLRDHDNPGFANSAASTFTWTASACSRMAASDKDYLEIEERRTLGAAYYYFSYRRIFGAVSLSSEHNATLKEKAAGRASQRIRAYSDFKRLLVNLFEELAATFFPRHESPG